MQENKKLRWVKFSVKTDDIENEEFIYWYYKEPDLQSDNVIPDRYLNDASLQTDAEYWAQHILGVQVEDGKCTFDRVTRPDNDWLKSEIDKTTTGIGFAQKYIKLLQENLTIN